MKDLSLHILDIAMNAVMAGSSRISIRILENTIDDILEIEVRDNGCGMTAESLKHVDDPFFTSRNKKTGLGIPLLKQQCEATGGRLHIDSVKNEGTVLKAAFIHSHIDRQPLGDMAATMVSLIRSCPELEFSYIHQYNQCCFELNTSEIRKELGGLGLQTPEVIHFIRDMIVENLEELNV